MNASYRSIRRARTLMLSPRLWRRRLVFWTGAILVGIAASAFAMLADQAQQLFAKAIAWSEYLPLALTPAVFAVVAWITARNFPAAAGSGIPQAIAAHVLRTPESRRYLLGARVVIAKIVLTSLALAAGASIGREGPTVQMGASIMLVCAALGGISAQRGIVLAGAAAGVAAAFNTPLAGIVFAIEEMARSFEHRNSGIVLTAIVLSGAASMSILGNYNYFGYADAAFAFSRDWMPVVTVGLLGGAGGSLFARMLRDGGRRMRTLVGGFTDHHPAWFAACCGLGVALLGLATHGTTYGTGYAVANDVLHEKAMVSWGFTFAKFAATALSNMSGIPGGLFSPSLAVGAALGSSVAAWFPATPLQFMALLGMVTYFAGVTQAPITAFVIVLEITGKGVTPAPLIAAAVIATAMSRVISPVSLYQALAKDYATQTRAILGGAAKVPPNGPAPPTAQSPTASGS